MYENNTSSNPVSIIEVTLSYEVEHLSATPTPTPTETTPENPQDWTMIIIVAAVVAAVIAGTVLVLKRRK